MKTTIETASDTFPSTTAAACMVFRTDKIEVVPDNTVTTLLRRELLAEITTGEGLGKLDQPGVAGSSDGQGRAEFGVYRCRDRLLISGTCRISGCNTKSRHVSRHRSPGSRPLPRRRSLTCRPVAPSLARLSCCCALVRPPAAPSDVCLPSRQVDGDRVPRGMTSGSAVGLADGADELDQGWYEKNRPRVPVDGDPGLRANDRPCER